MRDTGRAKACIVSGDRRRTHDDIRAHALCAATGFAQMGIGADDAVALFLRNDFAMFEAALAASHVGAFAVPINWHADRADVAYILRDCGAKALVGHADLLADLDRKTLGGLPVFVVDTPAEVRAAFAIEQPPSTTTADTARWDDWLGGFSPIQETADGPSAPIIYTSGTTGRPKGVRRTGGRGSKGSSKAVKVYGLDLPGPIMTLINGPMYHSVPNAYARLALEAGADILLEPRFDPEELLALIAHHRVTHMHIVPAMFVQLLRLPDAVRRRYDVGSLRYVVHGAAPCSREVKAAMLDWFGPVIHEYYGSTETGLLTLISPEETLAKPNSVGRPLPGITLHILAANGDPMPNGESGEVYAGSATLHAFTYIGQDEKRAEAGRGDLVTAGDVGWLDAEGYLFLRDRKRDLIRSAGCDIAPATVEAALLQMKGIRDCAVFGIMRDEPDETICVCIEPVEGTSLDLAELRRTVEAATAPGVLIKVATLAILPREDSGKIFKTKLRRHFE